MTNGEKTVVCISGASGFVGNHLIKLLLQDHSVRLRLLLHSSTPLAEFMLERIEHIKGDLLSPTTLHDFVHKADIVINLAYLWDRTSEENVTAVKNLHEVSVRSGVRRFIHCSTAVVVGRVREKLITENTTCCPNNDYEKSKYAVEQMLLQQSGASCETVILRPTAVFGVNGKNLLKTVDDIRYGCRLVNHIKSCVYGTRKMNLVPVEDVVGAIRFLCDYAGNLNKQVFIISSDDACNNNYKYIEDAISRKLGKRLPLLPYIKLPLFVLKCLLFFTGRTAIEPMTTYSSEKIHKLGYVSPVSFEAALERFLDWYVDAAR